MKHPPIFSLLAAAAAFLKFRVSRADAAEDYVTNPLFYCAAASHGSFAQSRAIPELDMARVTATTPKLSQVQVMTRYGTRVRSGTKSCWKGHDPMWDCKSGERLSAWVDPMISGVEDSTLKALPTLLPFTKKFDARTVANKLKKDSVCELNQLLPAGYKQFHEIGKIIANRYFKDVANKENNLFDLKADLVANTEPTELYFRSSDTQRTRMSGMQLLTSMAKEVHDSATDPMITLHTAEKESETFRTNEKECYDLVDARKEAYGNKLYNETFFTKNKAARNLVKELMGVEAKAGDESWLFHVQDCLGAALCLGHAIPGFVRWTRDNIELMFKASMEETEWLFHANNAYYSKVASAVVSYDFKASIVKHICKASMTTTDALKDCAKPLFKTVDEALAMATYIKDNSEIPDHKFIYMSAHSTTIGPFLAAFGIDFINSIKLPYVTGKLDQFIGLEKNFPHFAAMMVFEIYTATEGYHFRFIYNGKVLTEHIPGCDPAKDLCRVKTLFKAMEWATADLAKAPCKMKKPFEFKPICPKPVCPTPPCSAASAAPFMLTLLTGLALTQL